ncbi:hypothetical protein DPMN_155243 [Dreissena polymorpha]|uniref:Uncharacterized protein n=1 Tax=Dreissena polymorpha TaxID=45954 RepID=A0A9D4JAQ4_DREPO|nr:hypothetical protein DPMN_155243 [Dreissena polymorpha]
MHALFKALEDMVRSVVQDFISQVITGINASLNDKLAFLTQANTHLKNQVAELLFQADRAEQYSRRNCLRITGIPELCRFQSNLFAEVARCIVENQYDDDNGDDGNDDNDNDVADDKEEMEKEEEGEKEEEEKKEEEQEEQEEEEEQGQAEEE